MIIGKRIYWPFDFAKKTLLLFQIAILCEYCLNCFNNNVALTNYYLVQLGIVFAISYGSSVAKLGWTHIYSLLLFTTFVFMVSTPLLSPLADGDTIRIAFTPAREVFDEVIVQKVLLLFSIYISTSYLFYFNGKIKVKEVNNLDDKTRFLYYSIGKKCLILLLPIAVAYSFYLMTISRADLYASGTSGIPFYIRVSNMIYTAGYFLIVASRPSFKQFSFFTLIYFISLIPTLLSGERGEVLLVAVFFIWYITKFYDKKIKWFIIAILGLLGVVTSYVISYTRQDLGIETDNVFKMVLSFFSESSSTFKLTAFYVEYRDAVAHNYPFFLDQPFYGIASLLFGLPDSGQSLEMLAVRSSLAHNLVYHINSGYYLGGNSMGTAWIAECYEFGIIGVMLGASLLSLFVKFYERRIVGNRFLSILTYLFFGTIIM